SLIVSNSYGYSYAADPQLLDGAQKKEIAQKLASVLDVPASFFMGRLQTKAHFVWLARDLTPAQSGALQGFKMYGLIRLQEQRRMYPYSSSAGQILGFTNVDGRGAAGIELEFDSILAGTNGYEIMQRDGLGRKMPSVSYPKVDPIPGCNIQLTLDMNIEQIVEQELAAGVKRTGAKAGTAVFMDPNTGEILAMATYPAFNPGNLGDYKPSDARDRAITDVYEPGSTFKIVTASAALEEGIVKPDKVFFADNGNYTYFGNVISDFEPSGWITFKRAIEVSSNIVFSKVGRKVGSDKFYRYARDFGFGTPTGITLPGEVSGELPKPYQWSRVSLAYMSFGYGVLVTTLQMAQAYAAIANGGTLMQPYIVNKITAPDGEVVFQNEPMEIRRVVTPDVAQTLTGLFVDVVKHGTGQNASVSSFVIAGKTGTARKLVDGKYSETYYHASFAGFFPVPDPQFAGYIMIDSPKRGYTGGACAAPIFKRIAERIYGIMQRKNTDFTNGDVRMASNTGSVDDSQSAKAAPATYTAAFSTDNSGQVRVPDVSFLDYSSAAAILDEFGLRTLRSGRHGFIVLSEKPSAGTVVRKGSTIDLKVVDASQVTRMPNFKGTSVRNATSFLIAAGIPFHVVGSGKIVSQTPSAGQPLSRNVTVTINCANRDFTVSSLY
ncbi:MAG: penicillin-binding transpeptidase domain-containing protein, partial [Bacteroidetes bacterium]|nr:penicillin-binding transpeptidase domain-containing protein [Bacteroidota bacterium]